MGKSSRNLRVQELLRQVLSDILHTRYQREAVRVTLTEVDVAPDHRTAKVFYTVVGGPEDVAAAAVFFGRFGGELGFQLGRKVSMKHTPRLTFAIDDAVVRGNRVLAILDELGPAEPDPAPPRTSPPKGPAKP